VKIRDVSVARGVVDLRDWAQLDLSGGNDSASILSSAIAQASAAGFTRVKVPTGDILVGSQVSLASGVHLAGDGDFQHVIVPVRRRVIAGAEDGAVLRLIPLGLDIAVSGGEFDSFGQ
jgi:hypothetical protein